MRYNIGVVSLGCSKNLVDTETMLGILSKADYRLVEEEEKADILIVNTCGFIESAKQESINTILSLSRYKETGNCKVLIVAGCLAERYNEELQREIPEIDAILGTGNFDEILEVIDETLKGEKYVKYGNQDYELHDNAPRVLTTAKHTAYLKIAEGCDHFCTYCIIPYLRGGYRSKKIESILSEAQELANQGVKELIIIAQDITEYGKDIYGGYKLAELLRNLSKIENIQWIRLLYSYPENITPELIKEMKENKKICHYIDIPLQHINDRILKTMGRKVTKTEILNLINDLRQDIPDIIIRTSLIVGFPGEDEGAFNELLEFVKTIKLDHVGVFTYSMEENTPAAKLKNQVDEKVKEERKNKIMEAQQFVSLSKNKEKIDKTYNILIESKLKGEDIYYGRSYEYAPDIDGLVYCQSKKSLKIGEFSTVKITGAYEYDLLGEIVDESCK